LARLYRDTSQPDKTQQTLQPMLDELSSGGLENASAGGLADLGAAARLLEMWQDANDLLRQAAEKQAECLRAQLEWGDLFPGKFQPPEAEKGYQAVLKINPPPPLALLGMARTQLTGRYNVTAANRFADQALAENPHLVDALDVKAGLYLDNEEYSRAEA